MTSRSMPPSPPAGCACSTESPTGAQDAGAADFTAAAGLSPFDDDEPFDPDFDEESAGVDAADFSADELAAAGVLLVLLRLSLR